MSGKRESLSIQLARSLTAEKETKRTNINLQRSLSKAQAKTADMRQVTYDAVKDAFAMAGGYDPIPAPKLHKGKGEQEQALIHVTDWHVGQLTQSYNMDVAEQRIMDVMAPKITHITELHRTSQPVADATILWGGDMTEGAGNIYPGQVHEIEAPRYVQFLKAVMIGRRLIADNLRTFRNLDMICEWGNHGRMGTKKDWVVAEEDNFDLLMYEMLRLMFEGEKRIRWQMSPEWYQRFKVGNYRGLLIHGDEIKNFGGNTPHYGIVRKNTAWQTGVIPWFHDAHGGHFHSSFELPLPNGGSVYISGTPLSDSKYAKEFVAANARPSQRLHFVHLERGELTSSYKIWLGASQARENMTCD